jgi:predicted membrane chloride channel (bestrophin family)
LISQYPPFSHSAGIEAAASEIEEPFGYDSNDIKFDEICLTVIKTIEFMVQNSL